MITYIFKFILASLIIITIYHLFLEKEKMHRFNRFYLLSGIIFSFVVPLFKIKLKASAIPFEETSILTESTFQNIQLQPANTLINDINIVKIIIISVYAVVSAYLLYRFVRNVFAIYLQSRNNNSVSYSNAKLVLTNSISSPYSFLNFIFVNSKQYKNGEIEDEILRHELSHVKQKHSIDILFIELLLVFVWLNPVLYLFKRSIQLNHEFLADESVVNLSENTHRYQYLLLSQAATTKQPILSSTFNFLPTKKRIIMMNKKESHSLALIKKIVLIPVIALISFLFSFEIIAKELIPKENKLQVEVAQEGVSQELLEEYQAIIKKHKKLSPNGKSSIHMNGFTNTEESRMEEIFNQMTEAQKLSQKLGFIPANTMYLKEVVLTNENLELYKDSKMYGIWIDDKRVNNEILNNYKNTDFSQVNVSKLMKNAKNYGKHYYQVNMMTNDHYRDYKNEVTSREGSMLVHIGMYKRMANN